MFQNNDVDKELFFVVTTHKKDSSGKESMKRFQNEQDVLSNLAQLKEDVQMERVFSITPNAVVTFYEPVFEGRFKLLKAGQVETIKVLAND